MRHLKIALSLLPLLVAACGASPDAEHDAEQSSAIVSPPGPCAILGGQLTCIPLDSGVVTPPPPVCDPPCRLAFERCVLDEQKPICLPLPPTRSGTVAAETTASQE
jgi:hypothetical protein